MKKNIIVWILMGFTAFVLLVFLLTKVLVEPWIREKIQVSVNEKTDDYQLKIEKVHVSFLRSGVELKSFTIHSINETEGKSDLTLEIESLNFNGIHLLKAVFRKDIDIREVEIFNSRIIGKFAFSENTGLAKVSPLNINIENLFFDELYVDVKSTTTAQTFLLKNGFFKVSDIHVEKLDTLSPGIFGQFDFDAQEFKTVTPDSLYTFLVVGINYSASSNTMTVDSFASQPNYAEYEFTARHQFQTVRIEGSLNQLFFHNFSAADFVKTGKLTSSYIEIGEIQLNVFRDKRIEFRHTEKPTFQDLIYNYPGTLNIDSLGIISGNIVYTEHAENAIEKGSIRFNEIEATIFKMTNDTIYKTEKAYLELKASALLMGKGKIDITLKSRIYDKHNTFAVNGSLSGMEASALNPFLEKTAFITITSGKINAMYFGFTANNTKATGQMKLLYEHLEVAFINKHTNETNAIIEQAKSMIANIVVIESNPMPGEEVRPGIIDYERDPERFLFRYVVKALLTGMKTSVTKLYNPKESKKKK
ncbi:MAG: hypothetical protein JW842_00825 [Prolixibacteraceae bacterium]|nr:hypothetical protein [Prolixibacteraceae bacterium]